MASKGAKAAGDTKLRKLGRQSSAKTDAVQGKGLGGINGIAGGAKQLAGSVTQNTSQASRQMVKGTAGGKAKDATGQDIPNLPDMQGFQLLEGMPVNESGFITDKSGTPLGKLVEGDPKDLVGMTVDGSGQILDTDG